MPCGISRCGAGNTQSAGKGKSLPSMYASERILLLSIRLRMSGGMAQLARASALQAEGPGFESLCLQLGLMVFYIYSEGLEG